MSSPKKRLASLNHSLAGLPLRSGGVDPSTEDEDHARALLDLSIALIDAALDIIDKHLQSDEQLRRASKLMPGGTVGKHFRHVIEMFQAFLLPLLPQADGTSRPPRERLSEAVEINYDALLPNSRRSVARTLPSCRSAMKDVRQGLLKWEESSQSDPGTGGLSTEMQRRVRLVAVTPTKQVLESSVGRELWFCSLHAIHHFSMLRTIAVHELVSLTTSATAGLSLPVEFGTAPSTLLYRAKDSPPSAGSKHPEPHVKSKL